MSGKYQRHNARRDSGILHLREVPQDWETKQLKRSVEGCVNGIWGNEPTGGDDDIIVIRVADFDRPRLGIKNVEYTKRAVSEKERERRLLKVGDLLLEKSGGGENTQVGQVVLFDCEFEAVCSNFVAKMTPLNGYSSAYLNYLFSSLYRDGINTCSIKQNTGIQNLDSDSYLSEHWAFPCLEEQTQIAKFLDYETAKIDALIEKQQQLIALLKEKRQAVISHAVTKGLNPDAPMRDSGVEWLGGVPAHWKVLNLNRVVRTFVDYRGRTPEKTDEGRPLVTAGAVRNGIVDLERAPQFVSEATYRLLRERGLPEVGDLLFTSEAPLGEVAIVEDVEIACAQRIIMFKLDRMRIQPRFMWLYLRSQAGQDEIQTKASGSTAEGIRADRLRRCRVLVPPLEEQADIVSHVTEELSGFDEILKKTAEQTELLQERRTALISAAVTGKIDVRGWSPPKSPAIPTACGEPG